MQKKELNSFQVVFYRLYDFSFYTQQQYTIHHRLLVGHKKLQYPQDILFWYQMDELLLGAAVSSVYFLSDSHNLLLIVLKKLELLQFLQG